MQLNLTLGDCYTGNQRGSIHGGVHIYINRENRIPAANQDLPFEVYFSGWEDHQNGEKCGDEAV